MKHLLPLLWIVILGSCMQTEKKRVFSAENVEAETRQMLENYLEDINQNGIAAELAYLDSVGDFFWVPPGFGEALGYDSVMSVLNGVGPEQTMTFNWETLDIQAMSSELAVYTGKVRVTDIDSSGSEVQNTMLETGVLIKRPDGWKLYCGQTGMLP